jgi:hypothetical protein
MRILARFFLLAPPCVESVSMDANASTNAHVRNAAALDK